MHYSALRTLRVLEREWRCTGHVLAPGMLDFFFFPLYGVFVPSAIRKKKEGAKHPAGLLPWGSVSSRPGGDAEGRKRGAERPKNSLGMLWGCARPLYPAPKCLLHGMGLGTGIGMGSGMEMGIKMHLGMEQGQGWGWGERRGVAAPQSLL